MEVKINQNGKLVIQQIEKLSNFRDIGGWKTSDGNFMKSGVLFRSDELSRVTDKDISILQTLNIKVICDLRTPNECIKKQAPLLLKNFMSCFQLIL